MQVLVGTFCIVNAHSHQTRVGFPKDFMNSSNSCEFAGRQEISMLHEYRGAQVQPKKPSILFSFSGSQGIRFCLAAAQLSHSAVVIVVIVVNSPPPLPPYWSTRMAVLNPDKRPCFSTSDLFPCVGRVLIVSF